MPAIVDSDLCIGCAKCVIACRFGGMKIKKRKAYSNEDCCECHACSEECPQDAISILTQAEQNRLSKAALRCPPLEIVYPPAPTYEEVRCKQRMVV